LFVLLPAWGEEVGMRGPLRWAETCGNICNVVVFTATLRIAERPLTLASLDLSPRAGRGD